MKLTGALKEFDGRKENNQLSAFLNAKIFAMICLQIERNLSNCLQTFEAKDRNLALRIGLPLMINIFLLDLLRKYEC